jgi:5-methylcytosine-specific restriction endonuclease McrA
MNPSLDPTVECVRNAVVALSEGRLAEAEQQIRAIDIAPLVQQREAAFARVWGAGGLAAGFKPLVRPNSRRGPSPSRVRAIYVRDHYICRYSHCQRATVSVDVLRQLSTAFPSVFPYHLHWRRADTHFIYYTHSASLEHLIPLASGDPASERDDNLLTACYACNDLKNYLPIERLGWHVTGPSTKVWAGLTEYLPALRSAASALPAITKSNGT